MKKILSPALSSFTKLVPRRLVDKLCGQFTPIFMLHRLASDNIAWQEKYHQHLAWCFEYLHKNGYQPISLHQLAQQLLNNKTLPHKQVVFTLDDGFYDQFELAAPMFNRFDVPYTCFVITDFLNQKLWPWDDQLSYLFENTTKNSLTINYNNGHAENIVLNKFSNKHDALTYVRNKVKTINQDNLYDWIHSLYSVFDVEIPERIPQKFMPMTWKDAQTMIDQGHDIAPHTVSHRILSQLNIDQARSEILLSKQQVESKLSGAKSLFAFPTGRENDYTQRDMQLVESAGIQCSVSTTPMAATHVSNIFQLPRYSLPENKFDFIQYLSFIEQLKSRVKK